MIKDLDEYVSFLYEIGKRNCCNEAPDKSTMSPLQQEILTGHILKRIPISHAWEAFSNPEIVKHIARYMITNDSADGKEILNALKNEAIHYFYPYAREIIEEYTAGKDQDRREAAGITIKKCEQTGEVLNGE